MVNPSVAAPSLVPYTLYSFDGEALFTFQVPNKHPDLFTGFVVEQAIRQNCPLKGVDLSGTTLDTANLQRGNFNNAWFVNANLAYTDFRNSRLIGADFSGARIMGANFDGAEVLPNVYLVGDQAIRMVYPVGSEDSTLFIYNTDRGVYIRRGCFLGTLDSFAEAVNTKYQSDNIHARTYTHIIQALS